MPNEQRFEVEFNPEELRSLTTNPDIVLIVIKGSYTYRPDLGTNVWEMEAYAEGVDASGEKFLLSRVPACPTPCPRTNGTQLTSQF